MDELDFIESILGQHAPRWTLGVVWTGEMTAPVWWDTCTERVALCVMPWASPTTDGWDFPCNRMAGIDSQGRHICPEHWRLCWVCAGCGAWLPEGQSGYCSQSCTRADHATQTWLGQRLGARYTTAEEAR